MRIFAPGFSLHHTLASGQLFRYEQVKEGFLVSHRDKAFVISQDNDALIIHAATPNVTESWLSHFFALDSEVPAAVDDFSAQALAYCGGMRVCRQDPWECTIGFICSQNNNIKRISQLMNGLARGFGKPVQVGTYTAYTFPNPSEIHPSNALGAIRSGYREKYLIAASGMLSDEWLESLSELSYDQAKEWIMTIPGVGPKVADCILLFAYQHHGAFPIDTWVEQIMKEQYGSKSKDQMRAKATKMFGPTAGLMQQYLFHYKRNN